MNWSTFWRFKSARLCLKQPQFHMRENKIETLLPHVSSSSSPSSYPTSSPLSPAIQKHNTLFMQKTISQASIIQSRDELEHFLEIQVSKIVFEAATVSHERKQN
ncbi:hypothetical protein Nepgr_029777 [Nepenthes gracilis]|uniref:Uncharacterized protein n=1 Tax=Nepenthes gracilis TaxID=150966 RepID=A0AAD3TF07_NEPGR|nr:hypothetical protein Nepgr_029777 [Nepenthes gracilis]